MGIWIRRMEFPLPLHLEITLIYTLQDANVDRKTTEYEKQINFTGSMSPKLRVDYQAEQILPKKVKKTPILMKYKFDRGSDSAFYSNYRARKYVERNFVICI